MYSPESDSTAGADRTRKVASVVHREISAIISNEMADPRVASVTVTDIRMSKDLKHARVFLTSRLPGQELQHGVDALNRAAAFVRRQLAARVKMKYTPALRFCVDVSIEHAGHVADLLKGVSGPNPK